MEINNEIHFVLYIKVRNKVVQKMNEFHNHEKQQTA